MTPRRLGRVLSKVGGGSSGGEEEEEESFFNHYKNDLRVSTHTNNAVWRPFNIFFIEICALWLDPSKAFSCTGTRF